MRVELGNRSPLGANGEALNLGAPTVTYVHIPDSYTFDPSLDLKDFALHLVRNPDITRLPDNEALLALVHPLGGIWRNHSIENPTFVSADDPAYEAYVADFFGAPAGRPAGLEQEYFTRFGAPGVGAGDFLDLSANITQNGRDIWAEVLGGAAVGLVGTATGSTSTTLTGASGLTSSAWIGHRIVVYSTTSNNLVWGNVTANSTTAFTVDQWYVASAPGGGSAGTNPTTPWAYIVLDGGFGPAWFMGLSTSTTALGTPSTNTTLPSEITTASGGLVRKICPWAHSASANTYTLTPVFTANGSDSLPVTIGSIGVFSSYTVSTAPSSQTVNMLFNTLLSTTATLSASGDQLTITETVTGT